MEHPNDKAGAEKPVDQSCRLTGDAAATVPVNDGRHQESCCALGDESTTQDTKQGSSKTERCKRKREEGDDVERGGTSGPGCTDNPNATKRAKLKMNAIMREVAKMDRLTKIERYKLPVDRRRAYLQTNHNSNSSGLEENVSSEKTGKTLAWIQRRVWNGPTPNEETSREWDLTEISGLSVARRVRAHNTNQKNSLKTFFQYSDGTWTVPRHLVEGKKGVQYLSALETWVFGPDSSVLTRLPRPVDLTSWLKLPVPPSLFHVAPCYGNADSRRRDEQPLKPQFSCRLKSRDVSETLTNLFTMAAYRETSHSLRLVKLLVALAKMQPKILYYFPVVFSFDTLRAVVQMCGPARGGNVASRNRGSSSARASEMKLAQLLQPSQQTVLQVRAVWDKFREFPDAFCYFSTTPVPQTQVFRSFPTTHVSRPERLLEFCDPKGPVFKRLEYMKKAFLDQLHVVGTCLPSRLTQAQDELIVMGALETDRDRLLPAERLRDESKCVAGFRFLLKTWPSRLPRSSAGFGQQQTAALANLNSSQTHAARQIIDRKGLMVLVGPGGTGKTFTVTTALAPLIRPCPRVCTDTSNPSSSGSQCRVLFLAPTRQATRKLVSDLDRLLVDGQEQNAAVLCQTVHQFVMGFPTDPERWQVWAAVQVVVVDESSMIDNEQMGLLLDCLGNMTRIANSRLSTVVLMGDPHQLPPVAAGHPFRDLVKTLESSSGPLKGRVLSLTQNVRTSAKEKVLCDHIVRVRNAGLTGSSGAALAVALHDPAAVKQQFEDLAAASQKSARGESSVGGTGVHVCAVQPRLTEPSTKNKAVEFFRPLLSIGVITSPLVQVICQRNLDAQAINALVVQHRKYPSWPRLSSLREGMKVLVSKDGAPPEETGVEEPGPRVEQKNGQQTERPGSFSLGKGDVVVVKGVDKDSKRRILKVAFEFCHEKGPQNLPKTVQVTFDLNDKGEVANEADLFALEYAFAFTVHKAQGASIERVVFVAPFNSKATFVDCHMMYTVASRARSGLTYVGSPDFLAQAVVREGEDRYSCLKERLQEGLQ